MRKRAATACSTLWCNRSGAAMVEFTLVTPLLVLLAFGMFGFGRALYQYQQVVNGVRDAARYLAHQSNPSDSTIQSQAQTLATKGCLTSCSSVPVRVTSWNPSDVNISVTNVTNGNSCSGSPCYNGLSTLHEITVYTNFNFKDVGLLRAIGFSSVQFHVKHQERNIPD
jgi:Flp pilus assembly protein TadG